MDGLSLASSAFRSMSAVLGRYGEGLSGALARRLRIGVAPIDDVREARREGFTWDLDLSDNLQRALYLLGSYDDPTIRAVRALMQPDDTVLDVGGNIGAFALPIAAHLTTGRVISVEPAPDTAATLRRHVSRNGLDDRVTVVEAALSNRAGSAVLHSSSHGERDIGTRSLEESGPQVGDAVRLVTCAELLADLGVGRVAIVKIDVEGHESAVLDGMDDLLRGSTAPRALVIELVAELQDRAGRDTGDIVARMRDRGYEPSAVTWRGVRPYHPSFRGNVLFTRA